MEKVTKTKVAHDLGISRQSLYYKSKQKAKDELLKEAILEVLSIHKSYGYRRGALALKINKKRVQRLMHKFKIRPYNGRFIYLATIMDLYTREIVG